VVVSAADVGHADADVDAKSGRNDNSFASIVAKSKLAFFVASYRFKIK
jgi:hypothetical protein